MSKVIVVVNAEVDETGNLIAASRATEQMIAALKRAIASHSPEPITVEVIAAAMLWSNPQLSQEEEKPAFYCPLTIELPEAFEFPAQPIYQACKDIRGRRQWVEQQLNLATGLTQHQLWFGNCWLPVVLTAKGALYGEVIGESVIPNSYEKPVDLPDDLRQHLYYLANQLLRSLSAPPAVYLVQFGFRERKIIFDRLWPFPAAPAIASIGVQHHDLFTCHWHCLTRQPILDLAITPPPNRV